MDVKIKMNNKMDRKDLERVSEVRLKIKDLRNSPNVSWDTIDVILNEMEEKLLLVVLHNL